MTEYDSLSSGEVVAIVIAVLVFAAIAFGIQFLFLRNLRDLLRQVSDHNRVMSPNKVFLNFIPLFGLVWLFITVSQVRDSVQAEFRTRNWPATDDFGYGVGLAYAIIGVGGGLLGWIPVLGALIGLAGLVCWIMYWVKTNSLKNQLMLAGPAQSYAYRPQYPAYGAYGGPGAPVQQRSCPSCGAVGVPGDDFCRSCGSRSDAVAGGQQYVSQDFSGQAPAAWSGSGAEAAKQTPGESGGADASAATTESGAAGATCPFCGATYRPQAVFCWSCGRPAV